MCSRPAQPTTKLTKSTAQQKIRSVRQLGSALNPAQHAWRTSQEAAPMKAAETAPAALEKIVPAAKLDAGSCGGPECGVVAPPTDSRQQAWRPSWNNGTCEVTAERSKVSATTTKQKFASDAGVCNNTLP